MVSERISDAVEDIMSIISNYIEVSCEKGFLQFSQYPDDSPEFYDALSKLSADSKALMQDPRLKKYTKEELSIAFHTIGLETIDTDIEA